MGREVLLINTNRLRPAVGPIGLDYTADTLRERGVEVRLLDLCFEEEVEQAIASVLSATEPLLVGLTLRNTDDCYLASGEDFVPEFAGVVGSVRRYTEAPLVVGGSGYSVFPEAILGVSGADFGIAGEGEVALAELAGAVESGGGVAEVPGLVWREGGEVRRNAPWLGDISGRPRRERALVDNERYFAEGGQAGVETKRGCDRGCIYCADPLGKGRRVRMRTPEQVAEEFETLLARGIDHFHLCDSEFNVPERHARACISALKERGIGARARWYGYAKPPIGTALAAEMRAAGCVGMNFGADSGDDEMLARLGRDFRVEDLEETARACREAGIVFMYDLLLGGPGETRETAARTIEVMKGISPDRVGVSLGVRVYPGTRLAEMVRTEGPMERNPNLRGAVEGNATFLRPVFYLSAELGEEAAQYVAGLVGGDRRFFFPTAESGAEAYNYSDNERLVKAIEAGYRGAYWDILRRLGEGE
ncbi:MAG TPA: radical SAM protein [Armatimonadota bacterium]|nr:radical SAM protein [Armatimonadota bacterium]